MERIRIPKATVRKPFIEPKPAWGVDAGSDLWIRCGGCGITASLDHDVAPTGEVSPSLVCPEGCGWHVWATLEGFQGSGTA